MPDAGTPPGPDVKDKKQDAPQKPEASSPPVEPKPEPAKTSEPPKAEASKPEPAKTEPEKKETPAAEVAKVEPPKQEPEKAAEKPAEPEKKKKNFKFWAEKGVDAAGFGGVWKAWEKGGNRFRNVMKSLGAKAADMIAGRLVSMTFKLVAITFVAGLIGGVSTYGTLILLALATGAASGIYSYGKDYLIGRFTGPKEKRQLTKVFDKARAKSAAISFGTGFAGGAFGLWLAKTEMFQNAMDALKNALPGKKTLSIEFNASAAAATPQPSADFAAAAAPKAAAPLPRKLAFTPG